MQSIGDLSVMFLSLDGTSTEVAYLHRPLLLSNIPFRGQKTKVTWGHLALVLSWN